MVVELVVFAFSEYSFEGVRGEIELLILMSDNGDISVFVDDGDDLEFLFCICVWIKCV